MGRLRGMSPQDIASRTDAVVEQTGIEEYYYRPIEQLSKGYRQRVGLAQAILSEPEILILDEPTEGLDPNQRVEIRALITALGEDRTVLLQRTCSRVVIIHRGRIVADGSVDELVLAAHRGARVSVELEAPADEARAAFEALESVAEVETAPAEAGGRTRLVVLGEGDADPRRDLWSVAAGRSWPLWELHLEQESLEDLFRELTIATDHGGSEGRADG